jgi:drug/metabolite transporter (DMT)-like permease
MILMVIVTRKKVIIGTILLLVGAMVMACGIVGSGSVVEKTYNMSDSEEASEFFYEMANKDPTPPLIDPVIILGVAVSLVGVVFLVKSKDKDFLPGI